MSIIETDCEVDFAPPLDYVEPPRSSPESSSSAGQRSRVGSSTTPISAGAGAGTSSSPIVIDDDIQMGGAVSETSVRKATAAAAAMARLSLQPSASPTVAVVASDASMPPSKFAAVEAAKRGYVPFAGVPHKLSEPKSSSSDSLSGGASGAALPPKSPGLTPLAGGVLLSTGTATSGASGTSAISAARPKRTLNRFEQARAEKAFQGPAKTLR